MAAWCTRPAAPVTVDVGARRRRAIARRARKYSRALANEPRAPAPGDSAPRGVVNVSEQGHRWKEHDEAVKMGYFFRT